MNGSQVSKLKRKAKCEELDINPGEPCKFGSHSFTNSEGNKGRCSACPLPFSVGDTMQQAGRLWRAAGARKGARKGLFTIA